MKKNLYILHSGQSPDFLNPLENQSGEKGLPGVEVRFVC